MIATRLSLFRRTPPLEIPAISPADDFRIGGPGSPDISVRPQPRQCEATSSGGHLQDGQRQRLDAREHCVDAAPFVVAVGVPADRTDPAEGRTPSAAVARCRPSHRLLCPRPSSRDPPLTGRRGVRGSPRPTRGISGMSTMIVSAMIVDSPRVQALGGPLGSGSAISMWCGR